MDKRKTSLTALALLLGGKGYSDFAANEIKRYWMRRKIGTPEASKRVAKSQQAFRDTVKAKLSVADQIVLGKWIGLLCKAQFEMGLELGLLTLVAELEKPKDAGSP